MRFVQFVKAAFEALRGNKLRSFLTMLGIVIGIAAIVIIIAIGNGAQSLVINQVSTFGSSVLGILPGSSDSEGPPAQVFGVALTSLTLDDVEALQRRVPELEAVSGHVRGVATMTWGGESVDSQFVGVSAGYPVVED